MELSLEQRAILAHKVIDVDAWVGHAIAEVGEWAVLEKIAAFREDYLSKKDLPNYRNRAERDAFKTPEDIAREEKWAADALTQATKIQAIATNLPSRAQMKTAIDAAFIVPKQNEVVTQMADVVYWLAKGTLL